MLSELPPEKKLLFFSCLAVILLSTAVVAYVSYARYSDYHSENRERELFYRKSVEERPAPREQFAKPVANYYAPVMESRLDIAGSAAFREKVGQALKLLKVKDARAYSMLTNYVYRIREDKKTDFRVESDVPTLLLRPSDLKTATWAAGAIAHELYKAVAYYDEQKKKRGAIFVPELSTSMPQSGPQSRDSHGPALSEEEIDKKACVYQLAVMKRAGAPVTELAAVETRIKSFSPQSPAE